MRAAYAEWTRAGVRRTSAGPLPWGDRLAPVWPGGVCWCRYWTEPVHWGGGMAVGRRAARGRGAPRPPRGKGGGGYVPGFGPWHNNCTGPSGGRLFLALNQPDVVPRCQFLTVFRNQTAVKRLGRFRRFSALALKTGVGLPATNLTLRNEVSRRW